MSAWAAAGGGGNVVNSAIRTNEAASNVWAVKLGTCNSTKGSTTATGNDTLQAAKQNVYGPYNLQMSRDHPQAKYMTVLCPASTIGDDDTIVVKYSICGGTAITDTTTWTTIDTIKGTNAKRMSAVDLSGTPGVAIAIKFTALSTGVLISKPIRAVFMDGRVENR
jgi:hypothetical protein